MSLQDLNCRARADHQACLRWGSYSITRLIAATATKPRSLRLICSAHLHHPDIRQGSDIMFGSSEDRARQLAARYKKNRANSTGREEARDQHKMDVLSSCGSTSSSNTWLRARQLQLDQYRIQMEYMSYIIYGDPPLPNLFIPPPSRFTTSTQNPSVQPSCVISRMPRNFDEEPLIVNTVRDIEYDNPPPPEARPPRASPHQVARAQPQSQPILTSSSAAHSLLAPPPQPALSPQLARYPPTQHYHLPATQTSTVQPHLPPSPIGTFATNYPQSTNQRVGGLPVSASSYQEQSATQRLLAQIQRLRYQAMQQAQMEKQDLMQRDQMKQAQSHQIHQGRMQHAQQLATAQSSLDLHMSRTMSQPDLHTPNPSMFPSAVSFNRPNSTVGSQAPRIASQPQLSAMLSRPGLNPNAPIYRPASFSSSQNLRGQEDFVQGGATALQQRHRSQAASHFLPQYWPRPGFSPSYPSLGYSYGLPLHVHVYFLFNSMLGNVSIHLFFYGLERSYC